MKLIDLLVKELPKMGGWPVNVSYIAQDEGSAAWGFSYKPEMDSDGEWMDCSDDGYKIRIGYIGDADDCNTSVVSRKQYESALAASKAVAGHNGWIQWAGGECPIDSDAIVEVKYRKPNPYQYNNDRAGDFTWSHDGIDGDIIAYRLHDQGINSRAKNDRLENDLNECIGQSAADEWDGEGLPPAGCECEVMESNPRSAFNKWTPCKVIHFNLREGRETQVCIIDYNGDFAILYGNDGVKFRPLRTEAERKRDIAAQALCNSCGGTGKVDEDLGFGVMWFDIYDAIAAGKIPGVKLEDK